MITLHYVELIECSLWSCMILCECPRQEKCYAFLGNPPRPSLSRALEPSLLVILLLTLSSISGDQMVATSMEFDYHSRYHSNKKSIDTQFASSFSPWMNTLLRESPQGNTNEGRHDHSLVQGRDSEVGTIYIYKPPDQPDGSRAFLLCLMKSSRTDKLIIGPFFIAEGQRGTVYRLEAIIRLCTTII